MKKKLIILLVPALVFSLSSCQSKNSYGGTVNYDTVKEYELTEDNSKELEEMMKDVIFETANAADNINAKISLKDFNFKLTSSEKSYKDGVLIDSVETSKIDFDSINAELEAGMHGLYSATKADEFYAYVETKEISGTIYTKSTQTSYNKSQERVTEVVENNANLKDNIFEYYMYNNVNYIHMSKELKNNIVNIAKIFADDPSTVTTIAAFIPSNGKIAINNDEESYPLATKQTREEMFPEKEGEEEDDNIFSSLLNLKKDLEENGYKLADICSVKVVKNKSHYLALNIEMTEKHIEKAKEIAKEINEKSGQEIVDLDFDNSDFKSVGFTFESNKNKLLTYANIRLDELKIGGSSKVPEEGEKKVFAIELSDLSLNLSAWIDYKEDASKRVPNVKELENYDNLTDKIKDLGKE